jgi:hypothetical protein
MKKFYLGPKFGTLINRKWITNIWVVTKVVEYSYLGVTPSGYLLQSLQ